MYMDEFITLYKSVEEKFSNVDEVLSLIDAAGISVKLIKFSFFELHI